MKKRNIIVGLLAVGVLLNLGGCATGGNPAEMVSQKIPVGTVFPQPLDKSMCVRAVTGGEETNPLWASKVSNQDFQTALTASLDKVGLTSSSAETCKYKVDANLLGLSQPSFGFDMTVTSHVNYKVYDLQNHPILLATVDAAHTATTSDAFVGVTRLRLANEGSIRDSISDFLEKLEALKF